MQGHSPACFFFVELSQEHRDVLLSHLEKKRRQPIPHLLWVLISFSSLVGYLQEARTYCSLPPATGFHQLVTVTLGLMIFPPQVIHFLDTGKV